MNNPVKFSMHSEIHEYINKDKSYVIYLNIEGKDHYLSLDWEAAQSPENIQIAIGQMFEVALEKK
jgi:hypothetical protein